MAPAVRRGVREPPASPRDLGSGPRGARPPGAAGIAEHDPHRRPRRLRDVPDRRPAQVQDRAGAGVVESAARSAWPEPTRVDSALPRPLRHLPRPEALERGRRLGRPLERPPVPAPLEHDQVAAHAGGEALAEARRHVGVVLRPEDERRTGHLLDVRLPLGADANRGAVEPEDGVLHGRVDVLRRLARRLGWHAGGGEPLRHRVGRERLHDLLAEAGRLPLLRDVVPDVLGVGRAVAARPGADEVGPERDQPLHQERAPVVADEIDGRADALDLAREPVDVRLLARGEARRQGASEARQRRRDDVGAPETGADRRPETVRVGDTVDEEGRHDGDHPIVSTTRNRAFPLTMRANASLARASGNVSTMARIPVAAAKRSVSSESFACPPGQAKIDCRRESSGSVETRSGSATAATSRSCPATPSPPITSSTAAALGAVARITRAPPIAASACPAEPFAESTYSSAPSCVASGRLSSPRAMATVRKPMRWANCTARCPRPPSPCTATRSPGRAGEWRSALKVVMPAQRSGAASMSPSVSGMRASASARANMYSP